MMKNFLIIFIGLCVTVTAVPQSAPSYDDDDFNLDPVQSKDKICITEDKREGICVNEATCTEAFNVAIYGIFEESDLRIGTCPGEQWCCVHPNMSMITNTTLSPTRGCRTALKNSCPWCVALYRNNPRTNAPELYCGGAVVGSRFVLTTALCALSHRRSDVWVRLPGGSRQYPVNTTVRHKQYHSGTKEHDVAFLLLNEDIEWPEGKQDNLGACLGLRTPLQGDCVAITFDDSDQLKFTPLTVTAKSCSQQGATHDAACGRAITSGGCSVAPGSPVLCPSGSDDSIIAGLVRQVCKQDATLLGSLMPSGEWITEQLTNLTLAPTRYTI
ncbi:uncharacterized protein isoform X2 [Choristoneura fumiferana]|uniref:uncharacterized protein isoform X1 n=1 Tax=Choristoneura fumiferana TaxID=7141 RepID=UPI003D15CA8A